MEKKIKEYKKIITLSLTLLFLSCKKETHIKPMNKDLNNILALSNYKISQRGINDSIVEYIGYNENFIIRGKYNRKFKHKIEWWNIYNKRNNEKYLSIQIFLEGRVERKNQIVFYNQNKIDTFISKFYNVKFVHGKNGVQKAIYNFYTPKSNYYTKNVDFIYSLITDKEETNPQKISLDINDNSFHHYEIDLSKYADSKKLLIGGLFSEYSYNNKTKKMGVNEIFIQDTIR